MKASLWIGTCLLVSRTPKARQLLYQPYGNKAIVYYTDVTNRRHDLARKVDLYVCEPPCQPFSIARQGKGMTDPRSKAFPSCVAYIAAQRPKCLVGENSHRLLPKISRRSGAP